MGVRLPSVQSNTLVNATVAINAETVIVTTPPFSPSLDNSLVLLFWYMIHTVGTTAASTTYRLRRGTSITGALINVAQALTAVAGNIIFDSGWYFDSPGIVAGQQYSLTCIDPASTVAGAVQDAALLAFAL